MDINKKIISNNEICQKLKLDGTLINDGQYELTITAIKPISGASGYRSSDTKILDKKIIIDYTYPVPDVLSKSIIPFFSIKHNSMENSYSVDYALKMKCRYDQTKEMGGATIIINEKGIIDENGDTSSTSSQKVFTLHNNNRFDFDFIPELIIGGKNTIDFEFSAYDSADINYKRRKSWTETFETEDVITTELINSYNKTINLTDWIVKEPNDKWEEILQIKSIDGNGEEKIETVTKAIEFAEVKNTTLHLIPKKYRMSTKYDGYDYDFFYENSNGPFYRGRCFKRKLGTTEYIVKRYDSVPLKASDKNLETEEKLLSFDENVKIEFNKYFERLNASMGMDISYSILNSKLKEMSKDEINYATLKLYNNSTNEMVDEINFKDKTMSYLVGIPIGIYKYEVDIHNEYLNSDDSHFDSSKLEEPKLIDIRPDVDEIIDLTCIKEESFAQNMVKIILRWNKLISDITNFKVHFEELVVDEETKVSSFVPYGETPIEKLFFDEIVIDPVDPTKDIYVYFTFDSDKCIFNKNGKIKHTQLFPKEESSENE